MVFGLFYNTPLVKLTKTIKICKFLRSYIIDFHKSLFVVFRYLAVSKLVFSKRSIVFLWTDWILNKNGIWRYEILSVWRYFLKIFYYKFCFFNFFFIALPQLSKYHFQDADQPIRIGLLSRGTAYRQILNQDEVRYHYLFSVCWPFNLLDKRLVCVLCLIRSNKRSEVFLVLNLKCSTITGQWVHPCVWSALAISNSVFYVSYLRKCCNNITFLTGKCLSLIKWR